MRGRDGKGKGKEREENWYPHFLDESYASDHGNKGRPFKNSNEA